ncbi:MAG: B12-binding domain-containing radical SAM protein, partial [Desulfosalsimonas sp.]
MNKYRRILLVYPKVPDNTYWSYKYALKFVKKKSVMPPLGLLTIAAHFPEDCELKLVDMNVEPLEDQLLQWADAVFISAMIVQKQSMEEIIRRSRQAGKTIVAGGPYPTNSHEEIKGVDHILMGEVDETLKDFLAELENGTAKHVYDLPKHPDISTNPLPRFDLLDLNQYASMAIQYSRGCPFHCEFCDIWTVYGNKPRLKSAQTLIAEIDALY